MKWFGMTLLPLWLEAMLIGNPADPNLMSSGILIEKTMPCTVRATVFEDFVYQQRFKDEFDFDGAQKTDSFAMLSTDAVVITVNFEDRFDVYGIVGASKLQLNREIFSSMQLSWGIGGKLT
ncbi:MAG: hypothetical protein FJZ64_01185, partial [Chlamydiae bacterium]|nr:hypothetical protein [Chlamydiota bacterium]